MIERSEKINRIKRQHEKLKDNVTIAGRPSQHETPLTDEFSLESGTRQAGKRGLRAHPIEERSREVKKWGGPWDP